jgi:hypothetical protein
VKPLVVTVTETVTCWEWESEKTALHVPALTPVAVNVAEGPDLFDDAIVAIDAQLSLSPNVPL